jgi:hypothetical protein
MVWYRYIYAGCTSGEYICSGIHPGTPRNTWTSLRRPLELLGPPPAQGQVAHFDTHSTCTLWYVAAQCADLCSLTDIFFFSYCVHATCVHSAAHRHISHSTGMLWYVVVGCLVLHARANVFFSLVIVHLLHALACPPTSATCTCSAACCLCSCSLCMLSYVVAHTTYLTICFL